MTLQDKKAAARRISRLASVIASALSDAAGAGKERDFIANLEDARAQCEIVRKEIAKLVNTPWHG
jgi:plasmid stabilization system protein ParE